MARNCCVPWRSDCQLLWPHIGGRPDCVCAVLRQSHWRSLYLRRVSTPAASGETVRASSCCPATAGCLAQSSLSLSPAPPPPLSPSLRANDDAGSCAGQGKAFSLDLPLSLGTYYFFAVSPYSLSVGATTRLAVSAQLNAPPPRCAVQLLASCCLDKNEGPVNCPLPV